MKGRVRRDELLVRYGAKLWKTLAGQCEQYRGSYDPICFFRSSPATKWRGTRQKLVVVHVWRLPRPMKVLLTNSNVWGGEFLHTTKQFSNTCWVSYDSTQFWQCLPEDGIRPHSLRAQIYKTPLPLFQMPITSPGCHLGFWPISIRSEDLTTPSWVQLIC